MSTTMKPKSLKIRSEVLAAFKREGMAVPGQVIGDAPWTIVASTESCTESIYCSATCVCTEGCTPTVGSCQHTPACV